MPAGNLAEILARYVQRIDFSDIPSEVIEQTKLHLLDTLGVGIAGTRTKWATSVLNFGLRHAVNGASTIWGNQRKLNSTSAALINGTAAHSLDFDDDPGICHIGAVIVPASIALGEEERISGKELLTAVIIGYDVVTRLEEALDGERMFARGFHPTAICGAIGAAAAASKILSLKEEGVTSSFGIAGSFASGLMEFLSDGSMTKRIHPGWAAQAGINAALLAKEGFTGPKKIFEGEYGLRAFSGYFSETKLVAELGTRFDVVNSSLKKYPCCLYSASAVDAILGLSAKNGLHASDVKSINARVRKVALDLVGRPIDRKQNPETVLDAQMSLPYSVAVALIDRKALLEQFAEDRIRDKKVLDLAKKITVSFDPEIDKLPSSNLATVLDVELENGDRISVRADNYWGHPSNPLSKEEVFEKFRYCSSFGLSYQSVELLLERIMTLETMETVQKLFEKL